MHGVGLKKKKIGLALEANPAALLAADQSSGEQLVEEMSRRASKANALGETLTLDAEKIHEEVLLEKSSPTPVQVGSPTQIMVFKTLSVDGELHVDNLMEALQMLAFPQLNEDWIKEVITPLTSFSTVDIELFVQFLEVYEQKQSEFFVSEFKRFDTDGSGCMDASELGELLKGIGAYPLPHVLRSLINEVDDNGSGQLELEEFRRVLHLMQSREGFTKAEVEELQKVFRKFDRDRSGNVNSEELIGILGWLGYPQRLETAYYVMRRADVDGSGDLTWEEFLVAMRWYREHEVTYVEKLMLDFDSDGNGVVDTGELERLLTSIGFVHPRQQVIFECMDEIGMDGNEPLVHSALWQVLQLFRLRGGFLKSEDDSIVEAFHQYDRKGKHGEGFINTLEVGKAMRMLGLNVPVELQQMHVNFVDVDGSGLLDLSEFRTLMRRHREGDLQDLLKIFNHYSNGVDYVDNFEVKTVDVNGTLKRALRRAGLAQFPEVVRDFLASLAKPFMVYAEFVDLAQEVRAAARERMRQNAGFTAAEVADYRTKFTVYDADGGGDIAGLELRKLLADIFPEAHKNADQRARLEKILREVDQDGDGSLDFADFLRLMRHYIDDCEVEELKTMNESFSDDEAAQFREIFNCEAKPKPGQDPTISVAHLQAMIIKICPLGITEVENLGKIIRECQEVQDSRTVDCAEFLRIMRKIVDTNLGGILGVTAQRTKAAPQTGAPSNQLVHSSSQQKLQNVFEKAFTVPGKVEKGSRPPSAKGSRPPSAQFRGTLPPGV